MGKVFMFALCVAIVATLAMAKREFQPLDMVEMHRLNALSAQSNRKGFVFGESKFTNATTTNVMNVYYVNYGNQTPVMTAVDSNHHTNKDYSPILLADGTIMFLSSRTGSSQIYVSSVDNLADAYQLTDFPVDVDTFKIGKGVLAFSTMLYPGSTMSGTAKIDKERSERWDSTQEWKKGFVRRWDAFWDGKFSHVIVVPLEIKDSVYSVNQAKAVDIMSPLDGDCPSRPSGDESEYSISVDGKLIAFTTQLGRNITLSTDLNVYIYNRETAQRECISCSNPATDTAPLFHPDGRHLYYLAMTIPGYEADTQNVMIYDLLTKETTRFNPTNDYNWGPLTFSPDGTRMYSSTLNLYGSQYYELKSDGADKLYDNQQGTFPALTFGPCTDAENMQCPIFLLQRWDLPSEVFMLDSKKNLIQVTHQNEKVLNEIEFTEATLHNYTGANNDTIYAWLHKPYGFQEGKKYPVIMYIHGGPEICWNNEFHYRWHPQQMAALGYAVFEPNLHGSYCAELGSAFTRSIRGNWGGWPFEDVMKGMDYLKGIDWINITNAAAMGASYGGYMMNWLNSQTNGTFRTIVCHDGVFDNIAMYYETDELYFMTDEFFGTPTDKDSTFKKYSPSTYAMNMRTPQLTIHGGIDFRISEVQAFGVFNNLQRLGVPSKLIRFPEENHWVLNPSNSLFWHSEVQKWLQSYLDN